MIDRDELLRRFDEFYPAGEATDEATLNSNPRGATPEHAARLFRAPGRVNLIGEHTDYNDGFVLPMAIERATYVVARRRADRRVRVRTLTLNRSAEFDLDGAGATKKGDWTGYVEGVARSLEHAGARLAGADLLIESDVPVGAGLSSSAALEISVGYALLAINEIEIDRTRLALAGQRAEHEFTGTRSGIMDQFISARGESGHALLIDCRTLEAESVPLDLSETLVVICDSNVKHSLATSEYNVRRAECERGVELLRSSLPGIKALRDVSVEEFGRHEESLPEPVRRRCRHVVTENERTLDAVESLRGGDLVKFGELMYASHASLRDDYEVSCAELDVLVRIAGETEGVFGARMTGGGFGGSTVNLVRRAHLDGFREEVTREYKKEIGRDATVYVSAAADGASEIA